MQPGIRRNPRKALLSVALAVGVVASGCGSDDGPATDPESAEVLTPETTESSPTTEASGAEPDGDAAFAPPAIDLDRSFDEVPGGVRLEVVATGLEAPWSVAFTDDGSAWISERDSGTISRLELDGTRTPVMRIDVDERGEGGLLGLATHDDELYAYFTSASDNRVVRVDPVDGSLTSVLTGIPKAAIHNGGRIAFGPDAKLYIGTGDAADPGLAQDPDSLAGKVLRVEPDGSIPDDNPTAGSAVYTLGHRNVQGLAWDDEDRLWITELGPDVDDELNLIEPGANYGWPEVTGAGDDRFADPALVMTPATSSPSGMAFVATDGVWADSLVFGALRGQRVWRAVPQRDGSVGEVEEIFVGTFGRVRALVAAPDGTVWLVTNNRDGRGQPRDGDDLIVRIVTDDA